MNQPVEKKSFQLDNSHIKWLLKKQKYQLLGENCEGAVKKCLYVHNSFRKNILCYKNTYGIISHRCIQMTPVPPNLCSHNCIFCWRPQDKDFGQKETFLTWNKAGKPHSIFLRPKIIIEKSLQAQKKIISGYKPFSAYEKWIEACSPTQVAISLAGEPLLYPWMPELVQEFTSQNFTTFLVTNGTVPEGLNNFLERNVFPTQTYVTVPAPNSSVYKNVCRPLIKNGWEAIKESLKLLKKFDSRTVIRLTVGNNLNMSDPETYAELIKEVNPSFLEIKGIVHVGSAQKRIPRNVMPNHDEITYFSNKINENLGYRKVGEKKDSKVIILSSEKHPTLIDF